MIRLVLAIFRGAFQELQLSLDCVDLLDSIIKSPGIEAGSGLAATLAASGTGILGCCGSWLTGGILLLAGVSSVTANQIAEVSPFIQVALIALFALAYLRFSRRLKTLAAAVS